MRDPRMKGEEKIRFKESQKSSAVEQEVASLKPTTVVGFRVLRYSL